MCVAMTYLHTPFIEQLIEQLEQVSPSIRSDKIISVSYQRFVQVQNGTHVELQLNLYKI
jgi:hypothetical protein